MSILKTLFRWFLEWAWALLEKWIAEKKQDKKEEKEVDKIIDKTKSPNLKDQLEGIEDAEERLNENT